MVGSALYAGKFRRTGQLGLSGSEIRFHGKTLLALVEKAQTLPEGLTAADA